MIDWPAVQTRLGVKADNDPGPVTYAALLSKVAGRTVSGDIGFAFSVNVPSYQVDANPVRLAAFVGQCAHESGGFLYTREVWGPTPAQLRYDGSAALGNIAKGDGYKYRGGGWIQVTGRHWFDRIGHDLGLDLINRPELSGQPSTATLMSLEWWSINGLNILADMGDVRAVTRRVNGGTTGLDHRIQLNAKALQVLA